MRDARRSEDSCQNYRGYTLVAFARTGGWQASATPGHADLPLLNDLSHSRYAFAATALEAAQMAVDKVLSGNSSASEGPGVATFRTFQITTPPSAVWAIEWLKPGGSTTLIHHSFASEEDARRWALTLTSLEGDPSAR